MMKYPKMSGLLAAPFTAFDENGEVNYSAIPRQVESLIADGVRGAYISGTTGEGISCSIDERVRIMEEWQKASAGRLTLIAHTGALSLKDVKTLSRAAVELKYNAFSVVPANFFKPADVKSLVAYCAEAASYAPELPFYYYHSMMSGVNFAMRDFLEEADGMIPNLAGVKFNNHNLYDYQNCLRACGGKYDIVYGVDEFFAGALAVGATSFIGSTYNYSAVLYHRIWEDFRAGNWAQVQKNMQKVCRGVDLLNKNGGLPAGKAMMLIKGIDCGNPRRPLRQLTEVERKDIADAMQKIIVE